MDISSDERWYNLLNTEGNDVFKPDLLPRTETDDASESLYDHLRGAFSVDDWAVRDALTSATATSQGTGFSAEPIKNLTRELDGGATDTSTLLSGELSPEPTCVTTVPAPVPASVPHPRRQPRPSYRCEVPSCHNPTFNRATDLVRHNACFHACEIEEPKLFCDYSKCPRHETPFYRIDHFRDHLRDLHKEDLFHRGCQHDKQWWNSRSSDAIFKGWWRCYRCLVPRVDIRAYGFVCPTCLNPCETERQEYRQRKEALGEEEEEGFDLGLNFEGGYY